MKDFTASLNDDNNSFFRHGEAFGRLYRYDEFGRDILLGSSRPPAKQILKTLTDYEIISVKIANTISGHSLNGEYATGKKAIIRLKIKEKILYTSDTESGAIHVAENEFYHSTFIPVPNIIEGSDPACLLKNNLLRLRIDFDDIQSRVIEDRRIYSSVCISLELIVIPTFQLCYLVQENKSNGAIYMSYENGTSSTCIAELQSSFDSIPSWSPNGQEIAYVSSEHGTCHITLINPKNLNRKILSTPDTLKSLSSFTWTPDGNNIIFTSNFGGTKDIFMINTISSKLTQLTYGNSSVKNYLPRCSPDGKYFGYLKNVSGVVNIYIQSMEGDFCKKITSSGHIRDFCWLDGSNLAVIKDGDGNPDVIAIIDINTLDERVINLCKYALRKRNIISSPDNKYISIIGSVYDIDDIYIIDIMKNKATNLTRYNSGVTIGCYCWNADSNRIFYSSNENFHYNVYSISIPNILKQQITNIKSTGINLCTRPRII